MISLEGHNEVSVFLAMHVALTVGMRDEDTMRMSTLPHTSSIQGTSKDADLSPFEVSCHLFELIMAHTSPHFSTLNPHRAPPRTRT